MTLSDSQRGGSRTGRLLRAAMLLPLCLIALSPSSRAGDGSGGVVYVESNTPFNTILAYHRSPQGTLFNVAGMPFPTGGSGVHPTSDLSPANLGPFDSDQNMLIFENRLYAVNSGSDTIAVFNIRGDGGLAPIKGSPFPSGGVNPVSLGRSGRTLLVANKDYDLGRPGFNAAFRRPNYTSFNIAGDGRPVAIPNSTIVADASGVAGPFHPVPTQMLVTPRGKVVFDATFLGFTIESFLLQPNGRLRRADTQALPGSESPASDNPLMFPVPLGLAAHPKTNVVYVGQVLDHKVAVYEFNENTGRFNFLRSIHGGGDVLNGCCWFVCNKAGSRLYAANNFSNSITVLDITNARKPAVLQTLTLAQGAGLPEPFSGRAAPFQIALDPAERFLHVVTQRGTDPQTDAANSLQVLKVNDDGLVQFASGVILYTFPSRPQGVIAR